MPSRERYTPDTPARATLSRAALLAASVLAFGLAACRSAAPAAAAPAAPAARSDLTPSVAAVGVSVRVPERTNYLHHAAQSERPWISIDVENRGPTKLDVSRFTAHIRAERDGVPIPCDTEQGAEPGAREPSTIAPRGRATFLRRVDCALLLDGHHEVTIAVAFGGGDWASPRPVGRFGFDVVVPEEDKARPIPNAPGLAARVGAGNVPVDAPAGRARAVVVLVNGSAAHVPVPRAKLVLRTYRAGSDIPCLDDAGPVDAPAILPPGGVHRRAFALSCVALGRKGTYRIVPTLVFDGGSELELGSIRIDVAALPVLTAPPSPWPRPL